MIARSKLRELAMTMMMGKMMKLSEAIVKRCRWKLPKQAQTIATNTVLRTAVTVIQSIMVVWQGTLCCDIELVF